jgi:hypothetical protein
MLLHESSFLYRYPKKLINNILTILKQFLECTLDFFRPLQCTLEFVSSVGFIFLISIGFAGVCYNAVGTRRYKKPDPADNKVDENHKRALNKKSKPKKKLARSSASQGMLKA